MPLQDSVKSLMNSRVISVLPETSILVAIDIILTNNFSGIPVTEKSGIIVGILTKYDLIVNRASIRDDMKVKDFMNNDPLVLPEDTTIEDAVLAFSEHHKVDPIPVVNADRKVIGVISRYDMVKLFREYGGISDVSMDNSLPREGRRGSRTGLIIFTTLLIGLVATLYYLGIPILPF